jgi:hypothetical protein
VNDAQAFGLENDVKGSSERAIVVVDQEPYVGSLFFEHAHHLSCLLGDPQSVWICRHACQRIDASRAQFDEEENVQRRTGAGSMP